MKTPLSWIKDFVSVTLKPDVLAKKITMAGIEVEEVIDRSNVFPKVVVGEIKAIRSHPNADKLRLATVFLGSGKTQEIVCGAPNIAVGQKVPVALLGAQLPNGLTIEAREIRGVQSQGMICAEDELGLGSTHSGVMILDATLKPGTPLAEALGYDEIVLDLSIPSNRSDLFSIRGVARDVAAITGRPFRSTTPKLKESSSPAKKSVSVTVANRALSPIYTARVIRGISIKPSPAWMQQRLRAAGMRPINVVVDVTNYVMLEYGQPLHAFDAAKVKQGKITVRSAKSGETLTTLDKQHRKLDPSMLVIADPSGPIALAGVMGGSDSEVTDTTKDIILEAAVFDPVSVRRTSRKLGLQSEASHRFEKGIPLSLPDQASRAAAALLSQLAGGQVEKGSVVVGSDSSRVKPITINPGSFAQLLGMPITPTQAKSVLTRLGFTIKGTKFWKVTVPEWRLDVRLPEDLIEEVGRIIGYDDLPEGLPHIDAAPQPIPASIVLKEKLRDTLKGFGFIETISHAYYTEQWKREYPGPYFEIANPLDKSQQYLRRSILPYIRETLEHAADAGQDVKVFQIGRVFHPEHGKKVEQQQPWQLAIGISHKQGQGQVPTIAGVLEALGLPIKEMQFDQQAIGQKSIKGRTLTWAEVDLAELAKHRQPARFQPLSKYPPVVRDISMWLPAGQSSQSMEQFITKASPILLSSVVLEDVFEKEGRRSVKFSLMFQISDRTLTAKEVDQEMEKILGALQKSGAQIR